MDNKRNISSFIKTLKILLCNQLSLVCYYGRKCCKQDTGWVKGNDTQFKDAYELYRVPQKSWVSVLNFYLSNFEWLDQTDNETVQV